MTYKPKDLDEVLSDLIGSALNDNAGMYGVDRDGEPVGPEFVHENDFDLVVEQAIKGIKESKNIEIRYKGEE